MKETNIQLVDCTEDQSLLNKNIDEFKVFLDENDKMLLLVSMFKMNILPLKALIFTNSVNKCYFLKLALECFNVSSELVTEEQSIEAREQTLLKFNSGKLDALIT